MKTAAFAALVSYSSAYVAVNTSTYLGKTAAQKSADIWTNITANTTSQSWYNVFQLAGLFAENEDPTFSTKGDQMPSAGLGIRDKLIHSVGTIGKIKWVSKGTHPYTGLFKGASYGYARMSLAVQPSAKVQNTAPGIGIKLLRDGKDSGNFVSMYSVDGQPTWNFFANDFTNHIPNALSGNTKKLS